MSNSFLRSSSVTHVWLDDSLVLLDTSTGNYFSLNRPAGQFFLSLQDEVAGQTVVDLESNEDEQVAAQLGALLEPLQAGMRIVILELLKNKLIRFHLGAEESVDGAFELFTETPTVSCWGTVATNTLTGS